MNSVKNLLIIAVLGSVGYGVYVSLARNNAEPEQPGGVAPGWPSVPMKVELPTTKSSAPPLALTATPGPPTSSPDPGSLAAAFAAPTAGSSTSGGPLNVAPSVPYPSSGPWSTAPALQSTVPAAPPTVSLGSTLPSTGAPAVAASEPSVQPGQSSPPAGVRNLSPPPTTASAAAANPSESLIQSKFAAFMEEVQKTLAQGKLAEAHQALSTLYSEAELPPEQAKQFVTLLDQLAGTIIYSRKSYLEPAYITQQGDTLDKLAQKYNVPWQLLARINGLMPANASNVDSTTKGLPLPAGQLKVVRGPFEAVVHLDRRELTLLVQDRYAGRFAIGIGRDQPTLDGSYMVREKVLSPTYYGSDGVNLGPGDPNNPLGGAWIGLSDRVGIHGTNDPRGVGRDGNRGAISVGDRDLQDLYGILSIGSRVTVMR